MQGEDQRSSSHFRYHIELDGIIAAGDTFILPLLLHALSKTSLAVAYFTSGIAVCRVYITFIPQKK